MAGTITISTLSDGTNSTSATNPILGSARAWVNFAGLTAAINASYNVSSVTKDSTGTFTVAFTNAFSDANYAPIGSATPTPPQSVSTVVGFNTLATGSVVQTIIIPTVGMHDPLNAYAAFFSS
jgi:hypothetical protein